MDANSHPSASLPKKIVIKSRLSSRYDEHYADGRLQAGARPSRWENRIAGVDRVLSESGDEIALMSDGQQSPPSEGWVVMLTEQRVEGYTWTLYGLPPVK
jgi:hypothetical protein